MTNPYDRIEAAAEIVADNPELADWYNHFQAMLEAFETDVSLLTDDQRVALSLIARQRREVVFGVWDLASRVHQLAYEEGFHEGLAAAAEPYDDEACDYDPLVPIERPDADSPKDG